MALVYDMMGGTDWRVGRYDWIIRVKRSGKLFDGLFVEEMNPQWDGRVDAGKQSTSSSVMSSGRD